MDDICSTVFSCSQNSGLVVELFQANRVQNFGSSADLLSCFHVQTIVCFSVFPDYANLNARHPVMGSSGSGHVHFPSGTSTWDALNCDIIRFQKI